MADANTRLIIDCGNSGVKSRTGSGVEDVYDHYLHFLDAAEFNSLQRRYKDGLPDDILVINGRPVVIGKNATSFRPKQLQGSLRYTADYYGVLAAASMGRLFKESCSIKFFGSHATRDSVYAEDLMQAVVGEWEVEIEGIARTYTISEAATFEESLGGWAGVVFSQDGTKYANSRVNGGRVLVLDSGGYTFSLVGINPGGVADYAIQASVTLGVNQMMKDFERNLRERYSREFRGVDDIEPRRIRDAFVSGTFVGGGYEYPCYEEAEYAAQDIVKNMVDTVYEKAGGGLSFDYALLTGGGGGLLYNRLAKVLPFQEDHILLAGDMDSIHMANVRGGSILWQIAARNGLL